MGTPNHHDVNYFKQRLISRHRDDREDIKRCIHELQEIVDGINRGLKVLKDNGKYPDQKVVDNQKEFTDLLEEYQKILMEL